MAEAGVTSTIALPACRRGFRRSGFGLLITGKTIPEPIDHRMSFALKRMLNGGHQNSGCEVTGALGRYDKSSDNLLAARFLEFDIELLPHYVHHITVAELVVKHPVTAGEH